MKKLIVFSLLLSVQAQSNGLGDFLINANGAIKIDVNQYEADKLCTDQGKRLPTARELALEGTRHGAKILELNQISSSKAPAGFRSVSVVNADGKNDLFYYSFENYVRPEGNLGNYWVWSSSVMSWNGVWSQPSLNVTDKDANNGYAFAFSGDTGLGGDNQRYYSSSNGAILCVPGILSFFRDWFQ